MSPGRPKWADLPRIDAEQRVATQVVSGEALAWARERAAAPRSEVAAGRLQGDCATCRAEGVLLYRSEPNDPESALVCAPCVRREARPRERQTLCDNDPGHGAAWRNPFTRRNEYFCGRCHAATDEGVVQNRWARVMDSVEPPAVATTGRPRRGRMRGEGRGRYETLPWGDQAQRGLRRAAL